MAKLILLLGGNIGDVRAAFLRAESLLCVSLGAARRKSSIYKSKAWGFDAPEEFLNQVLEFESDLLPNQVLSITQNIEKQLGRQSKSTNGYSSRPIDIDILFYGDMAVSTEELSVPHPLLHERRFTLEPLMELWPDLVHPVMRVPVSELYSKCPDNSLVEKDQESYSLVP